MKVSFSLYGVGKGIDSEGNSANFGTDWGSIEIGLNSILGLRRGSILGICGILDLRCPLPVLFTGRSFRRSIQ